MTTEIAKPSGNTLKQLLQTPAMKEQIARALPTHVSPERMIRIATTALLRNPKLQECTQESFAECLLRAAAMGLEPDGHRAHLIPFRDKKAGIVICTLILDYKGIVELALRNGDVHKIHADVVCENDIFEENLGEVTKHVIDRKKERGRTYAAYAMVWRQNGSRQAVVMSRDEVEAIRKRSRSSDSGPWVTDWPEMAKKTAFRRLSKWLTLSPEIRDQLAEEDAFEFPDEQITVKPRPANQAEAILSALEPKAVIAGPTPEDEAGIVEHPFDAAAQFAKLRSVDAVNAQLLDLQANGGYTAEQDQLLALAAEERRQQISGN